MNSALCWALTAFGITGLLLVPRRPLLGWAINLAAQPLWFVYDFRTKQWGFVAAGVVFCWVYGRNTMASYVRSKKRKAEPNVKTAPRFAGLRKALAPKPKAK